MFQTEPNHFLQSFDSPFVRWLMTAVTITGYDFFYIFIAIVLFFGVSMKRSFIIIHMLLWTGLLVAWLKDYFALPRPENVDSTLKVMVHEMNGARPFQQQGAKTFFSLPSPESIEYFRIQHIDSFGFPSGHVSSATVFWGGVALLFRQAWLRGVGLFLVLLMPFSRMFLGRHFLADVLGGLLVGGFVFLLAWYFLIKKKNADLFLTTRKLQWKPNMPMVLFLAGGLAVPFGVALTGNEIAARFFGFNLGFLVIGLNNFPSDDGSVLQRSYRVLLGLTIIGGSGLIMKYAFGFAGLGDHEMAEMFRKGLETFLLIWGTTALSRKFGLYERSPA